MLEGLQQHEANRQARAFKKSDFQAMLPSQLICILSCLAAPLSVFGQCSSNPEAPVTLPEKTAQSAQAEATDKAQVQLQQRRKAGEQHVQKYRTTHPQQAAALEFLYRHMPPHDLLKLEGDYLEYHIEWAYKARQKFAWAQQIDEQMFFNDVLPYAVTTEGRERWRESFYLQYSELVKDCKDAREAALKIASNIEKTSGVSYNTKRRRPDQGPLESMQLKMASCTGLSILLIDALRSVGIPARMAGVLSWSHTPGNHNWVECYVDGNWHMLEFGQNAFNTAWVIEAVSMLDTSRFEHKIWASSYRRDDEKNFFPMVWAFDHPLGRSVGATDVSEHYIKLARQAYPQDAQQQKLYISIFDEQNRRIEQKVRLVDAEGKTLASGQTRAGTSDMNEMLGFMLPRKGEFQLLIGEQQPQSIKLAATRNVAQVLRLQMRTSPKQQDK